MSPSQYPPFRALASNRLTRDLCISSRYLKPGGKLELVEIDWRMQSDDPAPTPCALHAWYNAVAHASAAAGRPLVGVVENLEPWLRGAGFSVERWLPERLDVRENARYEVDETKNQLARLHRALLFDPAVGHLEGMAMRVLTQRGWSEAQVRELCEAAREEIKQESFLPFHMM